MARGFFITGTDTGIGKTTVALGLMSALQDKGLTVAVMKPVSAGCEKTENGLRNEDAVRLMQQASIDLPYEMVNPYAFGPAIAPHIAAVEAGTAIDLKLIKDSYQDIARRVDVVVVEGAGGWLVPINEKETMADVARVVGLPIILVVGMRLGCLNHALLTQASINNMGLSFSGWVANYLAREFSFARENQQALEKRLVAPLLGAVPFREQMVPRDITNLLDIRHI